MFQALIDELVVWHLYTDLLHLTGEWMNADMLYRGTEDRTPSLSLFLAHLTQRVRWAIAIAWRPSSSSVVRRKLFQKSSPLKVLDQWKPHSFIRLSNVINQYIGVKPLIHQSVLGTYTKVPVVPFQEKSSFHFVVLWTLLNGMD
jgi:hypothetical protein